LILTNNREKQNSFNMEQQVSINENIASNYKDVMGFLNEIQGRYPGAISLAAGRPDDGFFDVREQVMCIDIFAGHFASVNGLSIDDAFKSLGQYNKTKGIIADLLASYLLNDEGIDAAPEDILVTVGAQEAFVITIKTICNSNNDVILVEDPGYIGVSDFAKISGLGIEGIRMTASGIDLEHLEFKLKEQAGKGKKVKLVFVMPNYQNPAGTCMPPENMERLLQLSVKYDFLVVEDVAYNLFSYSGSRAVSLKSADKNNRVIYIGSFAKSLFPGLRLGVLAATQRVVSKDGKSTRLADEMAKVKAVVTVNTPTINQAILGGILLKNNNSLAAVNAEKIKAYKDKRDAMLAALQKHIGSSGGEWAGGITWNEPAGGFFIRVKLPFPVYEAEIEKAAKEFGVLFCPMSYFSLDGSAENEIRLTFASLSASQIDEGVSRLAGFLQSVACQLV
jgi:DNA-binding transcriptional MocR family regulator